MRIPSGTADQVCYFVALDSTDLKTRETGLTTFTVYRSRNGAAAAAFDTPTVEAVDNTNMPGVYKLLLDEDMTLAAGNDSEEMVLHITHAGMAPVTLAIELYRPLPTAFPTFPANFDDLVIEPATSWVDIVLSDGGTTMGIASASGGFTEAMAGRYLYLEHTAGVGVALLVEFISAYAMIAYYPQVFYDAIFADSEEPVDLTGVRGVLGGRVAISESNHRPNDTRIQDRLVGTIATGTHVAQTGNSFTVVSSATHGNAALKTLIDAIKTVADAVKAVTDGLVDGARIDLLIDAIKAKTDNLPATPAATGDAMTLTAGQVTAFVAALEAEIVNDATGEEVKAAIIAQMLTSLPDIDELSLAAIAEAVAAAVAAAVGAGIADDVWSNDDRTLTSSSSTVGPTAATEASDIYTTAHKNGTRRLDARVRNWDGDDILQADISSIAYTAYLLDASNPDTRTAITGHSAVSLTIADVIFGTLQTDEYSSNYNFSHTPPIGTTNLFTIAGRDYLIEYTITPTSGEKIIVRFRVACK